MFQSVGSTICSIGCLKGKVTPCFNQISHSLAPAIFLFSKLNERIHGVCQTLKFVRYIDLKLPYSIQLHVIYIYI